MKTKDFIRYRLAAVMLLLFGFAGLASAQEGLQIATLFGKYKDAKEVTYVELNGSILRSYAMSAYRSLVFEQVTPHKQEILQCIRHDVTTHKVEKTQEVTEGGELRSAYYRLSPVVREGREQNRYILYKTGKQDMATLVYIEGPLTEEELMEVLYKR